jgi:hypothetical protein
MLAGVASGDMARTVPTIVESTRGGDGGNK